MLWVGVLPMRAEMTPEREAQFYYDFYAGQKAMNDGRYAQAFCLFRLCADIHPTDARTQDYLGIIYDALHLKDSARVAYARAYQYAPNELYQHHVSTLMEQNRFKEAFTIMQAVTKAHPEDEDAWHALLQLSMILSDYKTATQAIDKEDKLLGPSPYSALVRYQIAIRQNKVKKALGHLDTYLEQVPDNPTVLNDYAYILATHKGDLNKAEQMSAEAIRLQPENSSFLDTYGWILHLKGKDTLARFYLTKALNLATDPNEKKLIQQHLEKTK